MARFEEHCEETKRVLGEEFRHVHLWLDDLFTIYGPEHRKFRYNKEGVEEVRRMWGDRAAEAARIHNSPRLGGEAAFLRLDGHPGGI